MTREELRNLGLTDEQVDGVMRIHGADVTASNSKIDSLNGELVKLKDIETKYKDLLDKTPTVEPENPELKEALQRIKDLEAMNLKKDIEAYALSKGLAGEDSIAILSAFGVGLDDSKKAIDSIAKIISDKSASAVNEKIQELAASGSNPQNGNNTNGSKTDDVVNAEQIVFGNNNANSNKLAQDYYK